MVGEWDDDDDDDDDAVWCCLYNETGSLGFLHPIEPR